MANVSTNVNSYKRKYKNAYLVGVFFFVQFINELYKVKNLFWALFCHCLPTLYVRVSMVFCCTCLYLSIATQSYVKQLTLPLVLSERLASSFWNRSTSIEPWLYDTLYSVLVDLSSTYKMYRFSSSRKQETYIILLWFSSWIVMMIIKLMAVWDIVYVC